jgi:thiol:disulfide interchange protein DsbA
MKYLLIPGLLCALLLSACNSGEQAPEPASDSLRNEPAALPPEVEAPAKAETEESAPQVVEESAADTDDAQTGDVPLMLAQADTSAPPANWKFKEGQHFHRLVPTQPTVGGADKVEVAEFFWYGCGHCNDFEAFISRWAQNKPANARFVRIPATWNPLVLMHAQLYYTEEVLAKNGKLEDQDAFHAAVFEEYHQRRNRMATEAAIQAVFERFGVSASDFQSTWKSFEVAQKLRVAEDLARRYSISGVPAIVVNGKYRTGGAEAGSYPALIEVINELVARESVR